MKYRALLLWTLVCSQAHVQAEEVQIDENCVVNILNRTIHPSGGSYFALDNVPSFMGKIRARATCKSETGELITAQTDYFEVERNKTINVGAFKTSAQAEVPTKIFVEGPSRLLITDQQEVIELAVVAEYAKSGLKRLQPDQDGVNFRSSNEDILVVDKKGKVRVKKAGSALISLAKDGVIAVLPATVSLSGDQDGDQIPDDIELALGLNPRDPADAQEDADGDGLSNLEEFQLGTSIHASDSDGDTLDDAVETEQHKTNPLSPDSDSDGLSDSVELEVGSDPNDAKSADYSQAIKRLTATPKAISMVFNSITTEVSSQLKIEAELINGTVVDLTSRALGTKYESGSLDIASFGSSDGEVFGGKEGKTQITVKNADHSIQIPISVERFDPSALSAIAIPGYANDVEVQGDFAFVASGNAGLHVVDVSDRRQPKIIATLDTPGTAVDVRILGDVLYLADGDNGLVLIDIKDKNKPKIINTLDTKGFLRDLFVTSKRLYGADAAGGLLVYDLSSARAPVLKAEMTSMGPVHAVAANERQAVVLSGTALHVIDVQDSDNPIRLGGINIGSVKDLELEGNIAYVAAYQSGYRVLDVSNPTAIETLSQSREFVPRDVAIAGDKAYFAEQLFPNVVAYVDKSNPKNAVFQGTIDLSGLGDYAGTGIAVDDSFAYITENHHATWSDYAASGNTKLFIAQHTKINDVQGIAPEVELKSPESSDVWVENIEYSVAAEATDDIAVKAVEFFVNDKSVGIATTKPFRLSVKALAEGKKVAQIKAVAIDYGDNRSEPSFRRVEVQKDQDDDTLGNEYELYYLKTDPNKADSDNDGLNDGVEVKLGTNPNSEDTDQDGLNDQVEVEQDTDPLNPDRTAPKLISSTPEADSKDIPENSSIHVIFDEEIRLDSLTAENIQLKQEGSLVIAGSFNLIKDDKGFSLKPESVLKDFTHYQLTIANIKDAAGNPLEKPLVIDFETGNFKDTDKPRVENISPASDASEVAVNSHVVVYMSEIVEKATVNSANLTVQDVETRRDLSGLVALGDDGRTLTFIPDAPYLVGRKYQVRVKDINDSFGNTLGTYTSHFTAGFELDATSPEIIHATIDESAPLEEVPLNARFRVKFSEAIKSTSIHQFSLMDLSNGKNIPADKKLLGNATELWLKPIAPLSPNTAYELHVGDVEDLSSNFIEQRRLYRFTTSNESDTSKATLNRISPYYHAEGIALNAKLEFEFGEVMDPLTIHSGTIRLYNTTEDRYVDLEVRTLPGRRRAEAVPVEPLKPFHKYEIKLSIYKLLDLAGNSIDLHHTYHSWPFTTGDSKDESEPELSLAGFDTAKATVPLNPDLSFKFSESLNHHCVNSDHIKLQTAEGETVEATFWSDNQVLHVKPKALLTAGQSYKVMAAACDFSGNQAELSELMQFSTATDAVEDNTKPEVVGRTPHRGTAEVAAEEPIVVEFSESLAKTDFMGCIRTKNSNECLAGEWTIEGSKATFKPEQPYPSSAFISLNLQKFKDLAGNESSYVDSTYYNYQMFRVVAREDSEPPKLVSMTPEAGSTAIGALAPIVLTFSEPMNPGLITSDNLMLFSNGNVIHPTIARSVGNRVVTLTHSSLPAAQAVSVVLTDRLEDLVGNKLENQVLTFTTAAVNYDNSSPKVVKQFPASGSSGAHQVRNIQVYFDEAINEHSLSAGFHVVVNGQKINGSTELLASGKVISFTADQVIPDGSLVQVYIHEQVVDLSGNAVTRYQSSFTTGTYANVAGSDLRLNDYWPTNGMKEVPQNTQITLQFSQVLDESTLAEGIRLTRYDQNESLAIELTLMESGQVVVMNPVENLVPDTKYRVHIYNNLQDTDGDSIRYSYKDFSFTTAAETLIDDRAPQLQSSTPRQGLEGVSVEPFYKLVFDEPINPILFSRKGLRAVYFSEGNKVVSYYRKALLPENQKVTERLAGIVDISGNSMPTQEWTFTTSNQFDHYQPYITQVTPRDGATEVAPDMSFFVEFNERINPLTLNKKTLKLRDKANNKYVPVDIQIEDNLQQVYITPKSLLAVGRNYELQIYTSIQDLAGKPLERNLGYYASSRNYDIQTALESEPKPLAVESTSILEGYAAAPTNAKIKIRFNQPVSPRSLNKVKLQEKGSEIGTSYFWDLSTDRRILTLTPKMLLQPNTEYELVIEELYNRYSHLLAKPFTLNFTTDASVDITKAVLTKGSPYYNAEGIALNAKLEFEFDKVMDPLTIHSGTIRLYNTTEDRYVDLEVRTLPGRRRAEAVPVEPLKPFHKYEIKLSIYKLLDLAGNSIDLHHTYHSWPFTTGDSKDESEPELSLAGFDTAKATVPLNPDLSFKFSESLNHHCVNSDHIKLQTAEGETVEATFWSDNQVLHVKPKALLTAGQSYKVMAAACDFSGNQAELSELMQFSTATDAVEDNTKPEVVGRTPHRGTAEVAAEEPIVVEFSESLAKTDFMGCIRTKNSNECLAGEWTIEGSKATFKPEQPYPSSAFISLNLQKFKDLAGNESSYVDSTYYNYEMFRISN